MGNIAGSKNMTVTNHGTIIGFANYGVAADDVSNFNLTNTGHIFGASYGVFATVITPGVGDGPTIDNSGSIRGGAGIWLIVLSGLTTTVVNETGGIIKGAPAGAIYNTGPGNLLVENHGKIKGDIVGNVAKDRVVNDGTIKGDIYLNDGDDIYKNKGGHADKVHGGLGNDTLIAGPHTDKFVFDTLLNPVNNVDRVKNFDPGTDKLFLSKAIFGALTGPGILSAGEFHKGSLPTTPLTTSSTTRRPGTSTTIPMASAAPVNPVRQARQGPPPPRQRLHRVCLGADGSGSR